MKLLLVWCLIPEFADKVACNVFGRVSCFFRTFLQNAAFNTFDLMALPHVASGFVDDKLFCTIHFLWCRCSRYCFTRVCIQGLFRYIYFLDTTAFVLAAR